MITMKSTVSHIHLNKHTFGKLFLLKEQHVVLYYLFLFDSDCVHIYAN
jgi:hypothetical protein